MARIRTIKPEFFTSEDVVGLSPLARLLFIALWCEADREGRMVWKPKTFKFRYLPADHCDPEELGQELIDAGLVALYGDSLAVIPTFGRHQHLNPREAASQLDPPHASATRRPRVPHASARDSDAQGGREGKGREGKGEEPSSLRSDSSTAEPSTDLLGAAKPADIKAARAQRLAQVTDEAITAFNASPLVKTAGGLLANVSPRVGREGRQKQVARSLKTARAICEESYGGPTITAQFWVDYWAECAADDHKSGRSGGGRDHPNWQPSFEFLTREKTMLEIYDRASSEDAA